MASIISQPTISIVSTTHYFYIQSNHILMSPVWYLLPSKFAKLVQASLDSLLVTITQKVGYSPSFSEVYVLNLSRLATVIPVSSTSLGMYRLKSMSFMLTESSTFKNTQKKKVVTNKNSFHKLCLLPLTFTLMKQNYYQCQEKINDCCQNLLF